MNIFGSVIITILHLLVRLNIQHFIFLLFIVFKVITLVFVTGTYLYDAFLVHVCMCFNSRGNF